MKQKKKKNLFHISAQKNNDLIFIFLGLSLSLTQNIFWRHKYIWKERERTSMQEWENKMKNKIEAGFEAK